EKRRRLPADERKKGADAHHDRRKEKHHMAKQKVGGLFHRLQHPQAKAQSGGTEDHADHVGRQRHARPSANALARTHKSHQNGKSRHVLRSPPANGCSISRSIPCLIPYPNAAAVESSTSMFSRLSGGPPGIPKKNGVR